MFSPMKSPILRNIITTSFHIGTIGNKIVQTAAFSISRCLDVHSPNLQRGIDYLRDPRLNKGLAFSMAERQQLGIQGLLAGDVKTMEEQVEICKYSLDRYQDPLNKYLYLTELLETNEKLFFNLLSTDIPKFLPICYTPVVGLACQKFGLTYRKPRGLFITINDKGRIGSILQNWPETRVKTICVTDAERILGLGDLGAYGMGIPVGKLILLTSLAGIHPYHTLPIVLDVGTNRQALLEDPIYIGVRQKRCKGKEYDELIDEFMAATKARYGSRLCVMFEDFALHNASRLLHKYRKDYCTFNDDIQGTAAVIVSGLMAACRITKKPLKDHVYVFLGAGSAGVGIADLICDAMVDEGLSIRKARKRIYLMDIDGLLSKQRDKPIAPHAQHFAKDMEPETDFEKVVKRLKATTIIGVSTAGGSFTPTILKQMAANTERPIVFALSNPTINSECTAQQAYDNTQGKCIFASGSPFPPVKYDGKEFHTGQGNNAYVFPGIAKGILVGKISRVPNSFFLVAAQTLSRMVKESDLELGRVYPPIQEIRCISDVIAHDIIVQGYCKNLCALLPRPDNIMEYIQSISYSLEYECYIPDYYDYPPHSVKVKSLKELAEQAKAKRKGKVYDGVRPLKPLILSRHGELVLGLSDPVNANAEN